MKLTQTLDIPASYFYRKIIDSVLYDIRSQTSETVDEEHLEGYTYLKRFSKTAAARLTITKLVPNRAYHYETKTSKSTFRVSYDFKDVDERKTVLNYEEKVISKGFMQQLNDLLVGTIMGFFRRRNFKKMLQQIEASY